nr:hypothetical protein [Tanacetum cinerariifolium]
WQLSSGNSFTLTVAKYSSSGNDLEHFIPNNLLSHQGLKAFQLPSESLMMIYGGNIPILDVSFLHFYPP